jgi:hypothetical protein
MTKIFVSNLPSNKIEEISNNNNIEILSVLSEETTAKVIGGLDLSASNPDYTPPPYKDLPPGDGEHIRPRIPSRSDPYPC